ncbi:MAG: sigma 54-interacting transcriptional regulator, partial [Burkholderiaceae bacterium]|nr:sigma 54-interacting transcriptional regulator [Burkholderiaceae bacterium]
IENYLFATTFRETLLVSFHGRAEFLGTLMEGIVAFTSEGRLLSANRSAQFQLGMPLAALRSHTLLSLFQMTSAQLLDSMRANRQAHLTLNVSNGAVVYARAQFMPVSRAPGRYPTTAHESVRPVVCATVPQKAPKISRLDNLDTGDPQIAAVIAKVRKVIDRDIPILITGETGTGKELLAQAIHGASHRRDAPLVAVNCASIPETLIESELFGYEEGAFTGARRKGAVGKLLQANGGTLFLDEIGDMPYALQARLLRVLQERAINPLGSTKTIPVNIAIICATHRDLREMIAQNRFRKDLYYRLNGLAVRLPPLRERTDLRVVIEKMLQHEAIASGNSRPLRIAPEVWALFERCAWPGNFRQIRNLLRTAAALVDNDGLIGRAHLSDDFFDDLRHGVAPNQAAQISASLNMSRSAGTKLQDVTVSAIAATLARHSGNVSAAARELGVARNTIYRRMPAVAQGLAAADALGVQQI